MSASTYWDLVMSRSLPANVREIAGVPTGLPRDVFNCIAFGVDRAGTIRTTAAELAIVLSHGCEIHTRDVSTCIDALIEAGLIREPYPSAAGAMRWLHINREAVERLPELGTTEPPAPSKKAKKSKPLGLFGGAG